jgi:hypothetical protein
MRNHALNRHALNRHKKYASAKELVALLIEKGADPLLPNKNCLSALDIHAEWSDDNTMFPGLERQFTDSVKKLTSSFVVAMTEDDFLARLREHNVTRKTMNRLVANRVWCTRFASACRALHAALHAALHTRCTRAAPHRTALQS